MRPGSRPASFLRSPGGHMVSRSSASGDGFDAGYLGHPIDQPLMLVPMSVSRSRSSPGRPLVLPSRTETEALAQQVMGRLTTKRALVVVRHRITASAQYSGNEIRA